MKTNTPNMMKKLALLLLLFTGILNAQIVNIPDANFKNRLLYSNLQSEIAKDVNGNIMIIDSNLDGEIQVSEAELVYSLSIYYSFGTYPIYDLTGVKSFTNLQMLYCDDLDITSLDVSNMTSLKILHTTGNNDLTTLNVNGTSNMIQIVCNQSNITTLDLSGLLNLHDLHLTDNQLQTINLSGNSNLIWIECINNFLTNVDISDCTNLELVSLNNNLISNIVFPTLSNIESLEISSNQLTTINVNTLSLLRNLYCSNNLFTTIDVSNNHNFEALVCDNNPNLISIFMKFGNPFLTIGDYSFTNVPNLRYICIDDFRTSGLLESLSQIGLTNVEVNSYCSFTPSENYNTISGILKNDADANGCDASDLSQPNIRVNINDGTNSGASFSNLIGNYSFFTQAGSFDVTPNVENPTWFTFSPTTATIPFADNNNNTATQNFCISPNGVHPDLEVALAPTTVARPGFDAEYILTYKNKGNQTLNGVLSFNYDVFRLLFISSNTTPDFNFEGTIDWNFTNLLPFESRSVSLTLNVNSPLETPAVNIGDILNFIATINPISGDELPDDNTFVYNQTVVGSFDPNEIICLEGQSVAPSEIGKYLHYVINFENTGNFPAENVVVKTIIDPAKFDINSLQLLNTSNPVDARITGNVVEFIFEDIQLAGPGGHGHVLLKVKSKNTLIAGDSVANRADIFFDYNAPVDTGLVSTIFQNLSNSVFEKDDSVSVSPNPTIGNVNINSNFNIKKVELYDVQGRIIETHIGETKTLDISDKSNCIYFLKITTEKGSKIEKVIKE
jgi:Secretion system C-terminal sorting domain